MSTVVSGAIAGVEVHACPSGVGSLGLSSAGRPRSKVRYRLDSKARAKQIFAKRYGQQGIAQPDDVRRDSMPFERD